MALLRFGARVATTKITKAAGSSSRRSWDIRKFPIGASYEPADHTPSKGLLKCDHRSQTPTPKPGTALRHSPATIKAPSAEKPLAKPRRAHLHRTPFGLYTPSPLAACRGRVSPGDRPPRPSPSTPFALYRGPRAGHTPGAPEGVPEGVRAGRETPRPGRRPAAPPVSTDRQGRDAARGRETACVAPHTCPPRQDTALGAL